MQITTKRLKTETQQVNSTIECERQESVHKKLAYNLHRGEKAISDLVYSTIADNDENDIPLDETLAWFRLERAQLLAASSIEASNSEKYVRKLSQQRMQRL